MIQDSKYRKKFKHRFSKNPYKRLGFKLDDLFTQKYFCTKCKYHHTKKWFFKNNNEFRITNIYERHFRFLKRGSLEKCEVKYSGTSDSLKQYFDDYIIYDSKDFSKNYQIIAGIIYKKPISKEILNKIFDKSTILDCQKHQCANCYSFKEMCEKYHNSNECSICLENAKLCTNVDDVLEKNKPKPKEIDV